MFDVTFSTLLSSLFALAAVVVLVAPASFLFNSFPTVCKVYILCHLWALRPQFSWLNCQVLLGQMFPCPNLLSSRFYLEGLGMYLESDFKTLSCNFHLVLCVHLLLEQSLSNSQG